MKSVLPAALAALVAAAALAQAPPAQSIASRITADGLKADVSFLASDALEGRGTPSRGLEIAAEFVASQFRRAGLEPVGDDGYFQTAPYVSVAPNLDGLELTLRVGDQTVKADKASIALQEAAAADVKDAAAVQTTMAAASVLTPDQVRGKVLLIEMQGIGGMRQLASLATRLQPVLIVVVQSTAPRVTPNARLREAAALVTTPVLVVWDAAVRRALKDAKEPVISAHIAAPVLTTVKLRNVVGLLRGSDPSLADTYIIVSGHYDHLGVRGTGPGDRIYNGANDDASGTSSAIEIAGALAALPERPKRSILFMALFGEEVGGLGSRYYGAHPIFPAAKTIANVNLEHMGRTDDDEGPRVGAFNLTGFDYTDIAAIFANAGAETGIQAVKHEKNSDAFFARSDNAAFAQIGIPSTTISVAYTFPDYHQPGDEWPKLDYDNMAKVDRTIALGILQMANSADAPHWNKENSKTAEYVRAREGAPAPASHPQ